MTEKDEFEKCLENGLNSAVETRKLLSETIDYDSFELASLNREVVVFEDLIEKYRAHKAKAVEAKATAEGSLVALCWELLEMAENPDAIVARATEDSEAVYKSECFDFEKARQTLSRFRPASPAVEELVKKLRMLLEAVGCKGDCDHKECGGYPSIEQFLSKYDNAKGR